MPKIFVSYRRVDSQERAHRIADWLILKYGRENVFIDIETIDGGDSFANVIIKSLDQSDVVLVVIGDQWVDEIVRRGQAEEEDFVRLEVRKSLQDVPLVIPVLLHRNVKIDGNRLPEYIQDITSRNYMYARQSPDFMSDMERIRQRIDSKFTTSRQISFTPIILGIIILVIIVFGGMILSNQSTASDLTPTIQQTAQVETDSLTESALGEVIRGTGTAQAYETLTALAPTNTPTTTPTPTEIPISASDIQKTAQAEIFATETVAVQTQAVFAEKTQNAVLTQQFIAGSTATHIAQLSLTPLATNTREPTHTPIPTIQTLQITKDEAMATSAVTTQSVIATQLKLDLDTATAQFIATQNTQETENIEETNTIENEQLIPIVETTSVTCYVSTENPNIAIHVGPGLDRAIRGSMPVNEEILTVGQAEDQDGNLWYKLRPDNVLGSDKDRYWVSASDLDQASECKNLESASASPIIREAISSDSANNESDSSSIGQSGITVYVNGYPLVVSGLYLPEIRVKGFNDDGQIVMNIHWFKFEVMDPSLEGVVKICNAPSNRLHLSLPYNENVILYESQNSYWSVTYGGGVSQYAKSVVITGVHDFVVEERTLYESITLSDLYVCIKLNDVDYPETYIPLNIDLPMPDSGS